jgi:hypothetical protein
MNWKVWLHGLISAVIGGAAAAVTTMIVAPDQFNLFDPTARQRLLAVILVSAILSAAAYLKQSPLPK